MTVEWNGDEVTQALRARLGQNMRQATTYLAGKIQRAINRGNADGTNPSLPGEPPKKVTARLFQSIKTDQRESPLELVGVVGSNVEYARRLELGFTGTDGHGRVIDQAPRPFLRSTLLENSTAIRRILTRG